jgi:hypothetical protein
MYQKWIEYRRLSEYKQKDKAYRESSRQKSSYYKEKLTPFYNIHKGERCFIVATGPSLRIEDLDMLKNEWTFTVNSGFMLYDKTDWRADYYGIVDTRAIDKFRENLDSEDVPVFFHSDFDVAYDGKNGVPFPKNDAYNTLSDTFWQRWFPKRYPETAFSGDITEVVYTGKSVVYAMLQIAAYMGFEEIYLLGVDCNYAQPKMYNDNAAYVDHKSTWTRERLIRNGNDMLPQYEVAKEYAKGHGFRIYNATRGGQLETFPRVELEQVLQTDKGNKKSR